MKVELYLPFLMVFFLIFDGGELTVVALVAEFDICVVDVDERGFLIGAEEHVLPIVMDSLEGLDAVVVKIRRADVCSTVISTS